jgi:hypothetical protein
MLSFYYWLIIVIAALLIVVHLIRMLCYRYRGIIGPFLESAEEFLNQYNDQYDHGPPSPENDIDTKKQ